MTTVVTALAALRGLIEADPPLDPSSVALPMYWQDDTITLPDNPIPFAYFELDMDDGFVAGVGGGRFNNLYRHHGSLIVYVLTPIGQGVSVGLAYGEQIASTFRSYRDANVSCFAASVKPLGKGAELVPDGLHSAAGNYAAVLVVVELYFDQVG
jgi:hypothetical protein